MAQPAGFWIRFVAYFLDSIILNIAIFAVMFLAAFVLGMVLRTTGTSGDFIAALGGIVGGLFGLVASWLYFAIMESSSLQGTFGKKAVGLIVTDATGERIGFGRATGRYFAKMLSATILLFGFLMIGWTRRKQGLHDFVAGTLVYKARGSHEITTNAAVFR